MSLEEIISKLTEAVAIGDEDAAASLAEEGLAAGADPMELVQQGIKPAMDKVGDDFDKGDAFLPELILAGDAAKAALEHIIPQIEDDKSGLANKGTVIIGTLYGDNHDIGKNIVAAILTANGFKVVDIGINAHPNEYVQAAEKEGADIIAASTLITTSLPYQREIVNILNDAGMREKYFVILGGGPVTPEWTQEIGADGYGRDANNAAMLCQKLMESGQKPPLSEPIVEGALKR